MTTEPTADRQDSPAPARTSKAISLRHALILVMALITAVAGGGLSWTVSRSLSLAVLTGGTAFAGSWRFYDSLIA